MYYNRGFTLIELAIAILIIGILAAIAYPSYQNYVIRTKRVDMMTEMQNIAKEIESRKLAVGRGGYKNVKTDGLVGDYPKGSGSLYAVTIDLGRDTKIGQWQITATPIANTSQVKDGVLSLSYNGKKCRASKCGMGKEWNEN